MQCKRQWTRHSCRDASKKGVSAERVVLSTLHAGGKFDNNAYKTSGGLHGVGSSVVNALSEWMQVKVYTGGKIYYDAYREVFQP